MEHNTPLFITGKITRDASFTKFKDLPPELRIKIWQNAIPDARTVVVKRSPSVRPRRTPTSLGDAISSVYEETWHSTTQIPALLHVNAEARYEALKHYTLSLGAGKSQPRVYVDFDRDTVFFGHSEIAPECMSLWASTCGLNRVQRLAIVPEGGFRVFKWIKADLGALQKLIFVHDTDENTRLGPLPQLVEDEQTEMGEGDGGDEVAEVSLETEVDRRMKFIEGVFSGNRGPLEETTLAGADPTKKRMMEAREEMNTLMSVLPNKLRNEPAVSTAVFRSEPETC